MQNHQIDELSVTDIRHTLHEMWRVINERRWYFVFPMCTVSTIAFLCALMIPRVYRASTVIKREHDPVFETVGDKQWTKPYQEIRARIDEEIHNPAFLVDVLASLGLPDHPNTPDGAADHPKARAALARIIAEGLSTSTVDNTDHREMIRISLRMKDPTHLLAILRAVRDGYVRRARAMTIDIMEDVKDFLLAETVRCRDRLDRIQRQVIEYELKYPGINPNLPDPASAEQSALIIERVEVERELEELALQRERIQTRLARLAVPAHGENGANPPGAAESIPAQPATLHAEPNPRYAELTAEINRLRREIADGRMLSGMTEAHPKIQSARRQLETRRLELADTPKVLMVSERNAVDPGANLEEMEKLDRRMDDIAARAAAMDARRMSIRKRLGEIEHRRVLAMEHRRDYTKVSAEAAEWTNRLTAWRKHVAPIQEALYLEDQDRSVHLATVREATSLGIPVAPDSMFVMVICLGVGLAAAVIVVLCTELIDRSYRTVKQLSTSLGVPVIESIDEIMTAVVQRRRLFRRLVLLPAVGVILLSAMVFSGTLAYYRLKEPGDSRKPETLPVLKLNDNIFADRS